MADLDALIQKIERAAEGSRAVDVEIGRLRDVLVSRHNPETGENEPYTHWHYTSSLRDARELAASIMQELGSPLWTIQGDFRYDTRDTFANVEITIPSYEFQGRALGKDAEARALCAAALRALTNHPTALDRIRSGKDG